MCFKFCITSATVLVYLFIHEGDTADELKFWEPDPQFDTRRVNEKSRNSPDENRQRFSYNRVKPTRQTPRGSQEPHFRAKPNFNTSDGIRRGRFYTRGTVNFVGVKPKQRKGKGRQGPGDDHKSTRIAPNDEKLQEKQQQTTESNNDIFRLSPYSIAQQLQTITSQLPEANVTMEVLGRTVEYNDIVLLKVTEKKSDIDKYFRADDSKYIDEVPEKKIIFIVHALSVMGVNKLSCLKYSNDFTKLLSYYFAHLDKFDIFLIPMANPDGYSYVLGREHTALWNKNLSPQTECAGVALDRNFDVAWNISKSISSCSQQYPGSTPFSEPETKAVRDVLHRYSHKIVAYMHLHAGSYNADSFKGDAVLYPKGFSDVQSDDDKYIDLKGEIDETMKNASFKYLSVAVDTLYNWYGKVYGTSVDYASTVYGIPYAMELVMQIYEDSSSVESEESNHHIVLEEVWARVIDVLFKSIWKNLHVNDV